MPIKRKRVGPKEIAEEFARQGLIPEDYKEEFAETLESELRRETRRLGGDVAEVVAKTVFIGHLASQGLAA